MLAALRGLTGSAEASPNEDADALGVGEALDVRLEVEERDADPWGSGGPQPCEERDADPWGSGGPQPYGREAFHAHPLQDESGAIGGRSAHGTLGAVCDSAHAHRRAHHR